MKKRSLVVSIAMLLVSAIVLSTSTYAWFSSGASVSVDSITAKIENTDGSIEISADQTTWGGAVTFDDLNGVAGNYLMLPEGKSASAATVVTNLTPISGSVNTTSHGMDFVPASLTKTNGVYKVTSQGTGATGKYVFYKFYLRAATAGTTVSITPNFQSTSENKFVIGAVAVSNVDSGNPRLYSVGGNQTYYPINASQTDVVDSDKNCILTPDDSSVSVGSQIKAQVTGNGGTFTNVALPDSTGTPVAVSAWIWVEGQHADCKDGVASSNGTISFTIGSGSSAATTVAG